MHQPGAYLKCLQSIELPEVFVCANDMIACDLLKGMREGNMELSRESGLVVFETSHDIVEEGKLLASVNVGRKQIASGLCMLLFDRMQNPAVGKRVVKLESVIDVCSPA